MPLISVVIPTYNSGPYIQETLASVLSQENVDFEVLILDDASTDNTVELASQMADERVRVFRNRDNLGRVANVNRSFDLARGDYMARLDHDDRAELGRLHLQAKLLDEQPDITVVGSQISHFGLETLTSDFPLDDGRIKARFIVGTAYLANPSTMFRRTFVQQHCLRFDPNLYIVDDLGFWFECAMKGAQFANLPQALTAYRIHREMTSMNVDFVRLYWAKQRLYSRLLPAYFPRLNGHDVRALLPLYTPVSSSSDPAILTAMHRAAGIALSEVTPHLHVNAIEARECLVFLLNNHRLGWQQTGLVDEKIIADLDAEFYQHMAESGN